MDYIHIHDIVMSVFWENVTKCKVGIMYFSKHCIYSHAQLKSISNDVCQVSVDKICK